MSPKKYCGIKIIRAIFTIMFMLILVGFVSSAIAAGPDTPFSVTNGDHDFVTRKIDSPGRTIFDLPIDISTRSTMSGPVSLRVSTMDVGMYPEGDMPQDLVITPDQSMVIICYSYSDTVTFLDINSGSMIGWVPTGDWPVSLAITSDGKYAVTTDLFDYTLTVIDVASRSVVNTISLDAFAPDICEQPAIIEALPGTHKVVVGCDISDTLHLVDLDLGVETDVLTGIPVWIRTFSFSSDTGKSYVKWNAIKALPDSSRVLLPDYDGNQVIFVDPSSMTVAGTMAVAEKPVGIDIAPDGTVGVLVHSTGDKVTVFDPAVPSVSDEYTMTFSVFDDEILITNDKQYMFIGGPINNMTVVRVSDGTEMGTISSGSVGGFAATPGNDYGFVGNFNARIFDLSTFSVVKTITEGSITKTDYLRDYPIAAALNSTFSEEVYVYNINGASGYLMASVWGGIPPEGDGPQGLAITPDGSKAVIANILSDTLTIVDLASKSILDIVAVGQRSGNCGITPDGQYALSMNYDDAFISIVDLSTLTKVADVTVKDRPYRVAFTPDGSKALIPSLKSTPDYVSVVQLSGASSTNIADIPVGNLRTVPVAYWTASGIDVNNDGTAAVVCNGLDDTVSVINIGSLSVDVTFPVGTLPAEVAFNPTNPTEAIVTNFDSDNIMFLRVTGIMSIVQKTVPVGDGPYTIQYTPDGSYAFVSNYNGNSISVIRISDRVEVKKITLSDRPRVMKLDQDGTWLYVGCTDGEFYRIQVAGDSTDIDESLTISTPMCGIDLSKSLELAVVSHVASDTISLVSFADIQIPVDTTWGMLIIVLCITVSGIFFLIRR